MFHKTILPDIPIQVDLSDLKDQFKLLSAEEITAIKNANLEQRRYTKAELKDKGIHIDYHIIRKDDDYFAVYHGVNKNKDIYNNDTTNRSVKFIQNITTGEWEILKIGEFNEFNLNRMDEDFEIEKKGLENANQYIGGHTRENKNNVKQNELLIKRVPGKNLYQIIMENKYRPASEWIDIFTLSLEALQNLHDQRILHRDIKPENIMYDGKNVTLIDFGISVHIPDGEPFAILDQPLGTKGYRHPDHEAEAQLLDQGMDVFHDEKTDIYSLAQTFAEALGLTWEMNHDNSLINMNEPSNQSERQYIDGKFREEIEYTTARIALYNLLSEMLNSDSTKIPDISSALKRLREIREVKLNTESKVRRIGYLDVNEFLGDYLDADQVLNKTLEFKQNELLNAIKSVDEIHLICRSDEDTQKCIEVKRKLEEEGFSVNTTVLQCDKDNIPLVINSYSQENINKGIYPCNIFLSFSPDKDDTYKKKNIILLEVDENKIDPNYESEINNGMANIIISSTDIINANNDSRIRSDYLIDEINHNIDIQFVNLVDKIQQNFEDSISTSNTTMEALILNLKEHESYLIDLENLHIARKNILDWLNSPEIQDNILPEDYPLEDKIRDNLKSLFTRNPDEFNPDHVNSFIDDCNNIIALANTDLDTLSSKTIQNKLDAIALQNDSEMKLSDYRRDQLKIKLVMQGNELKEILEKIIVLENLKKQQQDLSVNEVMEINNLINLSYQTISENIFFMDKINTFITLPDITEENYQIAYNQFTPLNVQPLRNMTESIRNSFGENTYAAYIKQARKEMDVLPTQTEIENSNDEKRIDTYKSIERSMHGYNSGVNNWRLDLFRKRMEDIINEQANTSRDDEFEQSFLEYYNPNKKAFNPEYKQFIPDITLANKINSAKTILKHKNRLEPTLQTNLPMMASENRAPDITDKKHHHNEYLNELERLKKYTHELNTAVNGYNKILSKGQVTITALDTRKSAGKKLSKLEDKVSSQLAFLNNHYQEYHSYAIENGVDSKTLNNTASNLVSAELQAKSALNKSEKLIPLNSRLLEDNFYSTKDIIENTLKEIETLKKETAADIYTPIINTINNIEDLTSQYQRMESRKSGLEKYKGGSIIKLLNEQKSYIKQLEKTKSELVKLKKNHDMETSQISLAYEMLDSTSSLLKNITQLPWDEDRKIEIQNKLNPIIDSLRELTSNRENLPFDPSNENTINKHTLEISAIKMKLDKLLMDEIVNIPKIDNTILDLMNNNQIRDAANITQININKNELKEAIAIRDLANISTLGLIAKFHRTAQISLENVHLEQAYRKTIIESSNEAINHIKANLGNLITIGSDDDAIAAKNLTEQLTNLHNHPANDSLSEFIQHQKKIEDTLNQSQALLDNAMKNDIANEMTLRDKYTEHKNITQRMLAITDLDLNVKDELTLLNQQFSDLEADSNTRLTNNTPKFWKENEALNIELQKLRDHYAINIKQYIKSLGMKSKEQLQQIDARKPTDDQKTFQQNFSIYFSTLTIALHEAQIPDDSKMPEITELMILLGKDINALWHDVNNDIEKLKAEISVIDKSIQEKISTLEKVLINTEESILSLDDDFKPDYIKNLEATKLRLFELVFNDKATYADIETGRKEYNTLLKDCDTKLNSIHAMKVISNELDFHKQNASPFIKTLEQAKDELDLSNTNDSLDEKHLKIIDIKNRLRSIVISSLIDTLDEIAASKKLNPSHHQHLEAFLDRETYSLKDEYRVFLDLDEIVESRLQFKLDRVIDKLNKEGAFEVTHASTIALKESSIDKTDEEPTYFTSVRDDILDSHPGLSTKTRVKATEIEEKKSEPSLTPQLHDISDTLIADNISIKKNIITNIKNSPELAFVINTIDTIGKKSNISVLEHRLAHDYNDLQKNLNKIEEKLNNIKTFADIANLDDEITTLENQATHLIARHELLSEKTPIKYYKIRESSVVIEEIPPLLNPPDTKNLSAAAQKFFHGQSSRLEFSHELLNSAKEFEHYPDNYEKLIAVAKELSKSHPDMHQVFTLYQDFNQSLPENLRLKADELTEPKLESIDPINIKVINQPLTLEEENIKQIEIPTIDTTIVSHQPTPQQTPKEISYSDLAKHLHKLNILMSSYEAEGIRAGKEADIHKLQQHVGDIHEIIKEHRGHPLYESITALHHDLFHPKSPKNSGEIRIAPPTFNNHYKNAKIAARDLENFADLYVGSKQKGIASITRRTNDILDRVQMDMRSSDKEAQDRLSTLLKDSEEMRAKINIIITKKQESSAPAILDTLRDSAKNLTEIIEKLNSYEGPTEAITYSTGVSQFVKLDQATTKENLRKIFTAMDEPDEANEIQSLSIQTLPIDRRLQGSEARVDPAITFTYEVPDENGGMFDIKHEYVDIASAVGTIDNKYMVILGHDGDIENLSRKQLLIIAAQLVNKFYDELPESEKSRVFTVSPAMPPELARMMIAYCKYSDRNYPKPNTSAVFIKSVSQSKQKDFEKEVESYLRNPKVVRKITSFSGDVILSENQRKEMQNKDKSKLDKMRGSPRPRNSR